jgi:hypothetical protein
MTRANPRPGRLAMPRRRGVASGLIIVVLGAIGALAPFVGPAIDLTIGPDNAFDMTAGRFWLSLLPGVVAVLAGLTLMQAGNRATGTLAAQIAMAAGIWFVIGPTMSMLWNDGTPQSGAPAGGTEQRVLELLVYFYGVGAAITALAGIAFGRVSARLAGDDERLAGIAAGDPRTRADDVDEERTRTGRSRHRSAAP